MFNSQLGIFLLIGIFFAPLAGIAAFLITYEEYIHHYENNKIPLKEATQAFFFAFAVFFMISLVAGFIFSVSL